jgi:hypothetical protein
MKKLIAAFIILSGIAMHAQKVTSPDKNVSLTFSLSAKGEPLYALTYKNRPVIKESKLGVDTKDVPTMLDGFAIDKAET